MLYEGPSEKYEKTYQIFQKALELKPDYPRYINDIAMIIDYYLDPKGDSKRKEEAEAMYKKAWRLGKEAYESPFIEESEKNTMFSAYTDAMVNLGRMYFIQKRIEECRAVIEELAAVAPDRPETIMLTHGRIPTPRCELHDQVSCIWAVKQRCNPLIGQRISGVLRMNE